MPERHRVAPPDVAQLHCDVVGAGRQGHFNQGRGAIDAEYLVPVQIDDLQLERDPITARRAAVPPMARWRQRSPSMPPVGHGNQRHPTRRPWQAGEPAAPLACGRNLGALAGGFLGNAGTSRAARAA